MTLHLQWSVKKLVKQEINNAAYKYLLEEASKDIQASVQKDGKSGIFMETSELSKTIFKEKSKTLDVKLQRIWKYTETLCSGCWAQAVFFPGDAGTLSTGNTDI